jgi:predicted RNA-binding protein YlxR (DUF448 family)
MRRGHSPLRTCLGCGTRDQQGRMIRLTVRGDGGLQVDEAGQGRGGYLHRVKNCWQDFLRRKHHYRAFRMELRKDAKEKLTQELMARNRE